MFNSWAWFPSTFHLTPDFSSNFFHLLQRLSLDTRNARFQWTHIRRMNSEERKRSFLFELSRKTWAVIFPLFTRFLVSGFLFRNNAFTVIYWLQWTSGKKIYSRILNSWHVRTRQLSSHFCGPGSYDVFTLCFFVSIFYYLSSHPLYLLRTSIKLWSGESLLV
jgi:hypothetical protein